MLERRDVIMEASGSAILNQTARSNLKFLTLHAMRANNSCKQYGARGKPRVQVKLIAGAATLMQHASPVSCKCPHVQFCASIGVCFLVSFCLHTFTMPTAELIALTGLELSGCSCSVCLSCSSFLWTVDVPALPSFDCTIHDDHLAIQSCVGEDSLLCILSRVKNL